jgi:hypothetical protein
MGTILRISSAGQSTKPPITIAHRGHASYDDQNDELSEAHAVRGELTVMYALSKGLKRDIVVVAHVVLLRATVRLHYWVLGIAGSSYCVC